MQQNPGILFGPIIGKVDHESVRFLFEISASQQMYVQFRDHSGTTIDVLQEVKELVPTIIKAKGLKPDTRYEILIFGGVSGSFRTFQHPDSNKSSMRFATVSCNSIDIINKTPKEAQLWYDLQNKIQTQQITNIIHMGDQIYVDYNYWEGDRKNAFARIEEMVQHKPQNQWDNYLEEARNIIRNEYKRTWNFEPIKYCLANASNKMILDDHEILDDAGMDKQLNDPNHWKGWYSQKVARYVYYEYSKQLWDDIDLNNLDCIDHDYEQFILNNNGFFCFDHRAHLMWYGDKFNKETYLGNRQKDAFLQSLQNGGYFKDVKNIFIVSPIPMVLLTERMTHTCEISSDDFKQHWIYYHKQELIQIFDAIKTFKLLNPDKTVTLIGGDVHIGGHYELYYKKKPFVKQLISSSINQKIFTKIQAFVTNICMEVSEQIDDNYSFEKHDLCRANNFGMVEVIMGTQSDTVNLSLVNNDEGKIVQGKKYSNMQWSEFKQKKEESCCNIF